jgi:crossover junction endodeoxyribonuclease RuvC
MRILGIDPGLNITGYGLIDVKNNKLALIEAGVIKTSSKEILSQRLDKIHRGLTALIREQKPDCMVLEKLYTHYRHPVTATLLGHARGVITLIATQLKLEFFEYPPKRIRKTILGNGNATKAQVQRIMETTFRLKADSLTPDIADALGLAVAHANFLRVKI